MTEGSEHAALLQLESGVQQDVQQLAKVPLADKARSQKLSAAIQDKLARIRALTRDLELEVEEMDSEDEERAEVATQLAQHKAQYAALQAALKEAALAQRTAALRSAQEERRELLAGGEAGLRQRRAQLQGDTVAAAEEVTGGLRRTRQVLAEELEHTSATLAAMESSHAALGRTRDEYHGQHRKLRKSRGLLGTLNWQAKAETYMLWLGLMLFLAVCAYVAQKRAGHFIPDRLKPSALLGSLTRSGGRVGRQPMSAPSPAVRLQAQVPPHAVHRPGVGSGPAPSPGSGATAGQALHGPTQAAQPRHAQAQARAQPPLPTEQQGWEEAEAEEAGGAWPSPSPPPPLPAYGGFVDPDEPEALPTYGPAAAAEGRHSLEREERHHQHQHQHQQQAVPQEHAEELAAHQPAEWPTGLPEPQGNEAQQAAVGHAEMEEQVGFTAQEQWGEQQEQHDEQAAEHEAAEWPTGSPEPEPQDQDQQLLAEEPSAEGRDQGGEAAEEGGAAQHAEQRPGAEAAGEQRPSDVAAGGQAAGQAAEERRVPPQLEDPPLPAVEDPVLLRAAEEHGYRAQAAAVGPEGGPEADAPVHTSGGAAATGVGGMQQQEPPQGAAVLDPAGRRIMVDGPDFVRTQPPAPRPPPEQGAAEGGAGESAAAAAVAAGEGADLQDAEQRGEDSEAAEAEMAQAEQVEQQPVAEDEAPREEL